jgi:xylono-1,5-lactonase
VPAFAHVAVACSQTCITGEAPLWDHRIGRLHWVDIRGPAVLTLDPQSGITVRVPLSEAVGFVALTKDPGRLVAGLKSGLAMLDLASGQTIPLVEVEPDKPGNRINDGTVAPDGAILFGTLDQDYAAPVGTYWRYAGGKLSALGGAAVVTNGPAVSGDGHTVLTIDSFTRKIHRSRYQDGALAPDGLFAELPAGQGVPDGATFDAEGHVWIAHYGGSRLSRFRPDGTIERTVVMPALQITKCAFGDDDLRTLYVTSAAFRRPLGDEPMAGLLFKIRTDTPGLAATIADV